MTSGNRAQTSQKRGTQADSRTQRTIPSGWEKPTPDSGTDREDVLTPPFDVGKDYEATEHFSTGGMGCTYKGRNKVSGQEVIIKIPHDMPGADARFERECETLHRLCQSATCPHIAQWLDNGSIEDKGRKRPYLVMELVRGSTLRQILQSRSVLPWDEVKVLLKHVNQALQFMNDSGVSHRDIKPDNLIYDAENKRWVLVDFGIAHDEGQQVMQTLISNEGTWDYMSPEQQEGKKVDIRSDIYSLGKVAWEALIGTCPRVGTEYPSKYVKDGKKNPSGSDKNVDDLIRMMTAADLEERFRSPDELSRALENTVRYVRLGRLLRLILKILLWVMFVSLLLVTVWRFGDYCIGREIEDAARKTDKCVALQEIENISRPFGMGDSTYNRVVPGLRRDTETERNEMIEEYNRLKGSGSEIFNMVNRFRDCKNFVNKWKAAGYGGDREIKEIELMLPDLKMEAELEEKIKPLLDGKLTIDGCFECLDVLKKYPGSDLTREYMGKIRENFKRAYVSDVDTKIARHQFNAALKELDRLVNANVVEREFIDKLKRKVEDERKAYEFSNVLDYIRKACDAKDYVGAREEVDKYKEKYPDDARVGQMYQDVAKRFVLFIADLAKQAHQSGKDTHYEDLVERIHEFIEIFPEPEYLQYRDYFSSVILIVVRERMWNIATSQESPTIKAGEIDRMRWTECNERHREYLNELRRLVIDYIGRPTYETGYMAKYRYQRAPISGVGKPTIYRVHIERIVVSMSDEYYKEMKGAFAADPRVSISRFTQRSRMDELYKADGPKGRQYFELPVNSYSMLDTENDEIRCSLEDKDVFDKAKPLGGKGTIDPSETSARWEFDNGTTIEIYYKAD